MSMTTAQCELLAAHYFENADHANVGDALGLQNSATAGSFYISLHTADPTETGTQLSSEVAYTGYARVAVNRDAGSWNITSGADPVVVSNAAAVTFGLCTAGSSTATHFGVGTDSSGAGNLLWFGPLDSSLAISVNITPSFAVDQLEVTVD